ncbi:hypothetical protein [Cellulosimicrobium sp. CUA-896]|nr:hypothetical protein [Cellulosimicrobium sp. CUA-896]
MVGPVVSAQDGAALGPYGVSSSMNSPARRNRRLMARSTRTVVVPSAA